MIYLQVKAWEAQNFFKFQDLANISCLQHKKTSPKFTVSWNTNDLFLMIQ